MLTATPQLHIRRPSPTTAEFTVTTCPTPTTLLPLRISLLLLLLLLRVALGLTGLLLLYSCYSHSPHATTASLGPYLTAITHQLDTLLLHTVPGTVLTEVVSLLLPSYSVLPPAFLALYLSLLRIRTTESLLVLRGLGIQTASSGRTYLSGEATRFIPTEKIHDVLINEAFLGFGVRYYLIVVVEGEEDVVVVFPRLLPRREIVERVWRGVRGCLYEGDREVGGKREEKG